MADSSARPVPHADEDPDLNSGFRAFPRDVALQYTHQLPPGFSCVTTITMAFLMNGYRVEFVPIDYETQASRNSTGGRTPMRCRSSG